MTRSRLIIAATAVIVAIAVGGFVVYDQVLRGDSAAALALPTASTASSAPAASAAAGASGAPAASTGTSAASAGDVAGTWNVAANSVAGYRVREQLANLPAESDAVGRTDQVTGSITIETSGTATTLTAGSLSVDMTSLASDKSMRDNRLRREGLETDAFPTATFTLTAPVEVPAAALTGTPSDITLTGDLTVHGVTKSVQIPAKAQLVDGTIQVAGSLTFPLSDYAIVAPNIGGLDRLDRGQRHARVPGQLHQGLRPTRRAVALARVGAARIELLADQAQLVGRRGRRRGEVRGDRHIPADRVADALDRRARVERVESHLAGVVEVVDAEVGDDDARPAPQPAALAPDPLGLLGAAEVAGRRPEIDRLHEAAFRLAHDHEDLAGVDRDLARAARSGQPRRRMVIRVR